MSLYVFYADYLDPIAALNRAKEISREFSVTADVLPCDNGLWRLVIPEWVKHELNSRDLSKYEREEFEKEWVQEEESNREYIDRLRADGMSESQLQTYYKTFDEIAFEGRVKRDLLNESKKSDTFDF